MGRQSFGIVVVSILVLFCVGILFVGQEYSSNSKLVTVRISGVTDEHSEQRVRDLMNMVVGIETVILDINARLCTFRYDSSKTNYEAIEAQFLALGLTISPISPIDLSGAKRKSPDQKLIRIQYSGSSQNR